MRGRFLAQKLGAGGLCLHCFMVNPPLLLYIGVLEQPEALERLESQMLQQESEISNMENRTRFALHCIHMETQLVYANMEVLSSAMDKLAEHERIAHCEVRTASCVTYYQ